MAEAAGAICQNAEGVMRVSNASEGLIVFRVRLPSGARFRIAIGSGETLELSPAVKAGLPDNGYFNQLVKAGKLRIEENA